MLTPTRLLVLLMAGVLLYALFQYSQNKSWNRMDGFPATPAVSPDTSTAVLPGLDSAPAVNTAQQASAAASSLTTSQSAVVDPSELLPQSEGAWGGPSPAAGLSTDMLANGPMGALQPISQVKRNTNLSLRAEIPIPKVETTWNQSTIEPQNNQLALDGWCAGIAHPN